MEATAAPTADGQETALKSNWILTHSFLLFTAITTYLTYYSKHTMVGFRYTGVQKTKVTPSPTNVAQRSLSQEHKR